MEETAKTKKPRRGHSRPRSRKGGSIATEVARPQKWDQAVSAAYLRILNATQAETAAQIGRADRTVRAWEGSPWWPDAVAEARSRWLAGGDGLAMRGIYRGLKSKDDSVASATARWWAERRVPELAPPRSRGTLDLNLHLSHEDALKELK